jgi:transposase, IS5 family
MAELAIKRANRSLRKLKTYLGRVIRDIERRIVGNEELRQAFVRPLFLARRVLEQERRQRGRKIYSLHAPEVECIGKGKAHRPYEFGVKVSVATTVKHSAGGQFVTHAAALPGNPYDGHTLATVIPQMQALIGNILDRCITDAGYRGYNAPPDHKFKVYTSGHKRRLTPRSSESSNGGPPASPSSAISRNITAWAATTSPTPAATPSTPCSPPPAIISAASSRG